MKDETRSCWLRGQIKTHNGDIVVFEFSTDEENPGGLVKVSEPNGAPGSEINRKALEEASGFFGSKMRELLLGGTNLFTSVRVFPEKIDGPKKT